jgi:hypothetical protein
MTDQYHPLLKAQTIQDKLEDKAHVYNQQAKLKLASLGDMGELESSAGIVLSLTSSYVKSACPRVQGSVMPRSLPGANLQ